MGADSSTGWQRDLAAGAGYTSHSAHAQLPYNAGAAGGRVGGNADSAVESISSRSYYSDARSGDERYEQEDGATADEQYNSDGADDRRRGSDGDDAYYSTTEDGETDNVGDESPVLRYHHHSTDDAGSATEAQYGSRAPRHVGTATGAPPHPQWAIDGQVCVCAACCCAIFRGSASHVK